MSLNINEMPEGNGDSLGRVEEGTHPARIGAIIELGVQPQTDHITGAPKKPQPRVMFSYVFPDQVVEYEDKETKEKKSFVRNIFKEYTVSKFEQAALMKLLNGLGKKDINSLTELLDYPLMVSVGTTGGGKAKIAAAMPLIQGMTVEPLPYEPISFDFDHPTEEDFAKVPAWIQGKITSALNYDASAASEQPKVEEPDGDWS